MPAFTAAAARALGRDYADQRYSASFPSPSTLERLAAALAAVYSVAKTPFTDRRDKLASLKVEQYIYADFASQEFRVLTLPQYNTVGNDAVMLCTYGDDMKGGGVPVQILANHFRGTFAGLVATARATHFALTVDPVPPDSIGGPDTENEQPSTERLNFGNAATSLASLPLLCPVPPGIRIPETMPFDVLDETFTNAFPFFAVWALGIVHAYAYNEGKSLELGGPFFNRSAGGDDDDIAHAVPTVATFAAFQPITDLQLVVVPLSPVEHPVIFANYRADVLSRFDDAHQRIGQREKAAGQATDDPEPPSDGGGSPGFDRAEFAKAIGEAIGKNQGSSLADKSHLAEVGDLVSYFRLLGARKDDDGNLVPGEVTPDFQAVLAATPLARAQELFATDMVVHLTEMELTKKDSFIVRNISLDPQLLKSLFGSTLIKGKVYGDTLVKDPTQCKKLLTFTSFLTPKTRSAAYKEQVDHGTTSMIQNLYYTSYL